MGLSLDDINKTLGSVTDMLKRGIETWDVLAGKTSTSTGPIAAANQPAAAAATSAADELRALNEFYGTTAEGARYQNTMLLILGGALLLIFLKSRG